MVVQFVNAQDKEYTIMYPNSKVKFMEAKFDNNLFCKTILKRTTYDPKGVITRIEEIRDGKRCGRTRIYTNGILAKEILFIDDKMISYKSIVAGRVDCEISADRNTIINKGRLVDIKWSRFYQVIDHRSFLVFDKKKCVDNMRDIMTPEQITQLLADITAIYNSKNIPGKNAVVTGCSPNPSVINDQNPNYKGTTENERKNAADAAAIVFNACASERNDALNSAFQGITGNAARERRINKAKSLLDKMISDCNSKPGDNKNGMFAAGDEVTLVTRLYHLAASGEAVAVEVTASAADVAAADAAAGFAEPLKAGLHKSLPVQLKEMETTQKVLRVAKGAADAVAGANTATGGAATATAGTTIATVVGVAVIGVAVAGAAYMGYKTYQAIKEMDAAADVSRDADARLAALRERQALQERESRVNKNTYPAPKRGGGPSTPIPPGMESASTCERAQRFKEYCDSNGWQTQDCEDFARFAADCKGDIREMYIAGDGDIMNIGCPSSGSAEDLARKDCQKRGMIAVPSEGGTTCRTNGGAVSAMDPYAPDQNIINPTRGDLSNQFANSAVRVMKSGAELSSALKNSTKRTMVVFMDPDCSYCSKMTTSLKSSTVSNAAKSANVDIIAIDATISPEVFNTYNIPAFPSSIIYERGMVTPTTMGSMNPSQVVTYFSAR